MTIAAVVTAAGRGTRLGSATPKALVPVVGRPLLAYALDRIAPLTSRIVVTAVPEPGALALLAPGLTLLARRSRTSRRS